MTPQGLYCPAGDFHIDPWLPVKRAIVTHAHADHARWGCKKYLTASPGRGVLQHRMGADAVVETLDFGEAITINHARVSLHPAGHILGSAQIRVEVDGHVAVVSGDYKIEPDPTCAAFEPVRCHHFITESTFGLPIYRWQPQAEVFADINQWWRANAENGYSSMILAYSLGKAQRVLAGVDASIGSIVTHGAVEPMTEAYRAAGVAMPATTRVSDEPGKKQWAGALVVAPPSALGSPWVRRFTPVSIAFASGWMQVRGARRRRAVDRGFVLSDHADWQGLTSAIRATGAERVSVTHGYSAALSRWLCEQGIDASVLETRFHGETDEEPAA